MHANYVCVTHDQFNLVGYCHEMRRSNTAGKTRLSRVSYVLSQYHNCDSTTIRLRYDDATTDAFDYDGSDRNYDLRSIRLRYDYDTTTMKH